MDFGVSGQVTALAAKLVEQEHKPGTYSIEFTTLVIKQFETYIQHSFP